jgi:signal transduction histidine kinase
VAAVNNLLNSNNISKRIVSITEDEVGKIWITADYSDKKNAGIVELDPVANSARLVYNEALQNKGSNPPVDIRSICSNKKGKVFVVFFRDDIFWFNSNTKAAITLQDQGRQYGLNNTAIDDMLSDAQGNIWCNNSLGLSQYKINQRRFSNYSFTNYELATTNVPAIYISPNSGKFYIGQSNSFLLFNHTNNRNDIGSANLLFNDFKVYNTSSQQKIKDGDEIVLSYRQDMVSIEFALLSYTNANENTYSWMLEGLEKEWNISRNNIATYNHLTPGKYTLFVKAANSNGDWKTTPIKLYIKITPAFYNTWWFRLLLVVLLAAFIGWLVRRRIKRIKDKFELRNRIAADLHDEIGSTLTSINILSTVSQQAIDQQPGQVKVLLEQISNQSKTIQQSMSDIVWSIRPDNEKIENLVVRIREYAAQTLEPLNILTDIQADELLLAKVLPIHYRKDILLICKEAVNNIAKHSNASTAKIVFGCSHKNIALTISDNGQWKGNNSGSGTKTMQDRARALNAQLTIQSNQNGTVVSMLLPLP